jgi:tRNA threonylcarbamoyladenosine biosynthesis protein TsaE
MVTCTSLSSQETEAIGQAWSQTAPPGWVIGLSGDLGAGKTCLVKGFARGLGITERVQSPSFALLNIHTSGRLKLFHLDLYRLDTVEQIIGAGLEEFLRPDGVTVIEWVEKWMPEARPSAQRTLATKALPLVMPPQGPPPLPGLTGRFRWAVLETVTETQRRITYEDFGA